MYSFSPGLPPLSTRIDTDSYMLNHKSFPFVLAHCKAIKTVDGRKGKEGVGRGRKGWEGWKRGYTDTRSVGIRKVGGTANIAQYVHPSPTSPKIQSSVFEHEAIQAADNSPVHKFM